MDLVGRPAFEALERPRVLAVDGDETPSPALLRVESKISGRDEALLVCEREIDAALERPQRCGQTGEADHGVQDEIRCGPLEQLDQVAADLSQGREPVDRLRARGGGAELQLGVVLDDLERLTTDRAGGAQEGDSLHPGSVGSPEAATVRLLACCQAVAARL